MQKEQLSEWVRTGQQNGDLYLLIVKDLEDQQEFPIYFKFFSDCERYHENIISESKLKIIELIRLEQYKSIQSD